MPAIDQPYATRPKPPKVRPPKVRPPKARKVPPRAPVYVPPAALAPKAERKAAKTTPSSYTPPPPKLSAAQRRASDVSTRAAIEEYVAHRGGGAATTFSRQPVAATRGIQKRTIEDLVSLRAQRDEQARQRKLRENKPPPAKPSDRAPSILYSTDRKRLKAAGFHQPSALASAIGQLPIRALVNAPKDIKELGTTVPVSALHAAITTGYGLGRATHHGSPSEALHVTEKALEQNLVDPYKQMLINPKTGNLSVQQMARFTGEHPVTAYLMGKGLFAAADLVAGKATRVGASFRYRNRPGGAPAGSLGSLQRTPETLPGSSLTSVRRGSPRLSRRFRQVRADRRAGPPVVPMRRLNETIDAFHARRRIEENHEIRTAVQAAREANAHLPKAERDHENALANLAARVAAQAKTATLFARTYGAVERPLVTHAHVAQAEADRVTAATRRRTSLTALARVRAVLQGARDATKTVAARTSPLLTALERHRERAVRALAGDRAAEATARVKLERARGDARVSMAKPKTSPALEQLQAQRKAVAQPEKAAGYVHDYQPTAAGINAKPHYHGTNTQDLKPENLDATGSNHANLFGPGVYLTDNPKVAASYATNRSRSSGTPTVYKAKLNVHNPLDLEAPAHPEFAAAVTQAAREVDSITGETDLAREIAAAAKEPGITNDQLYHRLTRGVSDASITHQIPSHEFIDTFQNLATNLRNRGFDALTHVGGKRVGGHGHHQATILLDPQHRVSVRPATEPAAQPHIAGTHVLGERPAGVPVAELERRVTETQAALDRQKAAGVNRGRGNMDTLAALNYAKRALAEAHAPGVRIVTPAEFDAPFREALAGPRGAWLTDYKPHERGGHTLLLSQDGKAGAAVKPDGDIVSVFRLPDGAKDDGIRMLQAAIAHGGTHLDAIGEVLRDIYAKQGFEVTSSVPWDDRYAPEGWNYERDGRPDIYFMDYAGKRGSAARGAPEAVPASSAPVGGSDVAGAGGQRGGGVAGARGADVPGLGRPAEPQRAIGPGPERPSAVTDFAAHALPSAEAQAVADATRGVRHADREVAARQRELDRATNKQSRLAGRTEGRHAAGAMTEGAGKAAADQAEHVGHLTDALKEAQQIAAAARGILKDATGAHRASVADRVREVDAQIAAERRRIAGVAPAEADALLSAIDQRAQAPEAVAGRRAHIARLDRLISEERDRIKAENLDSVLRAQHARDAVRVAHGDNIAAHEAAQVVHKTAKQQLKASALTDPAAEGRVFDNKQDALTTARVLNERDTTVPTGNRIPLQTHLLEPAAPATSLGISPVAGARQVSITGGAGHVPLRWTVKEIGDGQWMVTPQEATRRMYGGGGEGAYLSHASVGTGKASLARTMRLARRGLTKSVLASSLKWLTGQAIEPEVRAVLTGAGPVDFIRVIKIARQMERDNPGSGRQFLRHVTAGGMHNPITGASEQLFGGPTAAEQFQGAAVPLQATARYATWLASKPGIRHLRMANEYTLRKIMQDINGGLEGLPRIAMAGHAIRHSPLMPEHMPGLMAKAIQQAADGLQHTPEMEQLSRDLHDMFGKYSDHSPEMRSLRLHWTPFIPWFINAAKFLTIVMPRDHPVRTALLADINQAQQEWRKKHHLSWYDPSHVPGYLMTRYPTKSGSLKPLGHYTPWGLGEDPAAAAAQQILPWAITPLENLLGINWKVKYLKNPDGTPFSLPQRAARAITSLLESQVPWTGRAAQLSGLESRYIDRQAVTPPFDQRLRSLYPWTGTAGHGGAGGVQGLLSTGSALSTGGGLSTGTELGTGSP